MSDTAAIQDLQAQVEDLRMQVALLGQRADPEGSMAVGDDVSSYFPVELGGGDAVARFPFKVTKNSTTVNRVDIAVGDINFINGRVSKSGNYTFGSNGTFYLYFVYTLSTGGIGSIVASSTKPSAADAGDIPIIIAVVVVVDSEVSTITQWANSDIYLGILRQSLGDDAITYWDNVAEELKWIELETDGDYIFRKGGILVVDEPEFQ